MAVNNVDGPLPTPDFRSVVGAGTIDSGGHICHMAFGAKKAAGRASPERPPNASVDNFGPGLGRLLNSRIAARPRVIAGSALLSASQEASRPTTAYGRAARSMSPITPHPASGVAPVTKSIFFAASPPPKPLFGGSSSTPALTPAYVPPPPTQSTFMSPSRSLTSDSPIPRTPQMLLPSSVLSPAPPKPLSLPTFTPYVFCNSHCFPHPLDL
jgi:hypothetical protein